MATKKRKLNEQVPADTHADDDDDVSDLLQKLYDDMSDDDIEKAECVPNGLKQIDCLICGAEMNRIRDLREHMKKHTSPGDYDLGELKKAPIYRLLNPKALTIEATVMRDFLVREINCKRHSQFYGILTEADVELHISDSETDDDDSDGVAADRRPRTVYACDVCDAAFQRRYQALFHQKTAHKPNDLPAECHACGRRFSGVSLLVHHLYTRCESDEKPISVVERFRQYLVAKNLEQFRSLAEARKELKQHRLSTAERLYECKVCDKTFFRSEHLTRHKAVHLPDEHKLSCPVCAKRFNRRDNLRTHMKVHMDGPNGRLCHNCGHYTTSWADFAMHMTRCTTNDDDETPRTHSRCNDCGKTVSDLRTHQLTHDAAGASTHSCHTCGKSFASKFALAMHERVHMGPGPFHCNYCAESFPLPNELAEHLRRHVGEQNATVSGEVDTTAAIVNTTTTTTTSIRALDNNGPETSPPKMSVSSQETAKSNVLLEPPPPPPPTTTEGNGKAPLEGLFSHSWQ